MPECIREPAIHIGTAGTREYAERDARIWSDDNVRRILGIHRTAKWHEQRRRPEYHGNGKAIHPNLRRFMRLIEQEAHRRGITV